ncbi:MAG: DUF4114 domain-containing protein [Cyanobacteria bacterium P01_D01_bin.105]
MKKLGTQFGVAVLSTLSLLSVAPSSAQAADLSLRKDLLDTFTDQFVQTERKAFDELALPQLDTSNLYWDGEGSVDVFFIDEGAAYKNQLLFSANDGPLKTIFENVSSKESTLASDDGVLDLGEGKSLMSFSEPTQLSFFIKANGFNGGKNIFGADAYANTKVGGKDVNTDGLSHLIAYEYFDEVEQENYTIIGFEDLWGEKGATGGKNQNSDRDFNDVVFAVRGLTYGKPDSKEVPEPSALLGLLGITLLGGKSLKRKLAA